MMFDRIKDYLIRKLNTSSIITTYAILCMILSNVFIETIINRNAEYGDTGLYIICISLILLGVVIYLFFMGKTYGYGFKRLSRRRISYYVENGFIIFLLCFSLTFAIINGLGYFEIIIIGIILFFMFERYMENKRYKLDMTRQEMVDYRTYENDRFYFLVLNPSGKQISGLRKGRVSEGEKVYIYDSVSLVATGKIQKVNHDEEDFLEIDCGEHVLQKYEVISTVADTDLMIGNKEDFMPVENVYLHTLLSNFGDCHRDPEYIVRIVESLSKASFIIVELLTDENRNEYTDLKLTFRGDEEIDSFPLFTNYDEIRKNDRLDGLVYRTRHVSIENLNQNRDYLIDAFSNFIYLENIWIRAAVSYRKGDISKAKELCRRYSDAILNKEMKEPATEEEIMIWAHHQMKESDRYDLRRWVKDGVIPADSSRIIDVLERYPLNIDEYERLKTVLKRRRKLFSKNIDGYRKLMMFIEQKLGYKPINIYHVIMLSLCFIILTMFVSRYDSSMTVFTAITGLVTILIIILIRRRYRTIYSLLIISLSLFLLVAAYDISDIKSLENIMWFMVVLFTICVFTLLFAYLKKKFRKKETDSLSITDINTDPILYLNDHLRIGIGAGEIHIDIQNINDETKDLKTIDLIRSIIEEKHNDLMETIRFREFNDYCCCILNSSYVDSAISLSLSLKEYIDASDLWSIQDASE